MASRLYRRNVGFLFRSASSVHRLHRIDRIGNDFLLYARLVSLLVASIWPDQDCGRGLCSGTTELPDRYGSMVVNVCGVYRSDFSGVVLLRHGDATLTPHIYPTTYHLKPLTDFRFSTTVRNMAC